MATPRARPPAPRRPARGTPDDTRARLVAAAAEVFNRDGYHGTDSNRLARAAGYAPGTFYKHFADKRAAFVAVYEQWVASEWEAVGAELAEGGRDLADRVVGRVVEHHRRWRGVRASLAVLVRTDAGVRAVYRRARRRQLAMLAGFRARHGFAARTPEEDALLLYTLERAADALGDGEVAALGLGAGKMRALLRDRVAAYFG